MRLTEAVQLFSQAALFAHDVRRKFRIQGQSLIGKSHGGIAVASCLTIWERGDR